jgi:hypothetical protein
MKYLRPIFIIFLMVAVTMVPPLWVSSIKARKSKEEFERMILVKSIVREKVEAYEQTTGHYPDSLDVLSFTNSPQELEIASELSNNISYRRTLQGYAIGWDGLYVHSH